MNRRLTIQDLGDRVLVVLDRPEVRNAIDEAMTEELHDVCRQLEREPRLALFRGAGQDFAAGADVSELAARTVPDALRGINVAVFQRVRRLPMPTIALVDGHAYGGGAELALSCDFRIGTPRSTFANPEARLGIAAAAGAAWRLKEVVGETLAMEILLAGRVLDATEAAAAGLLSEVVEPDELEAAGSAMADRVLRHSALALRLTKQLVQAPAEAHPLIDSLAQTVLLQTEEARTRMTGFLERSKMKESS